MFVLPFVCMFCAVGYCLITPLTKSDGSLDVSSLLNHLALLEHSMEVSTKEITELKSQFHVALIDLKIAQSELTKTQTDLQTAEAQIKVTQEELKQLKLTAAPGNASYGGATFPRWGRITCPGNTNIIYKGYTAGTKFTDKASSASILCLPDQPVYAAHTSISYGAYIYGTEYETHYSGNPFRRLDDEDMPCVVCESETRSSAIMVPARNRCYRGWNLKYWGYLMGASQNHASAEYICVDSDPESIPGGHANSVGQSLYIVVSACGSLPCPPYENYWELSCVVCSK